MIVTVFRSRLREGCDLERMFAMGERMAAIAASMPGFISYKDYSSADGENLTLVEFEDAASLLAWRNHQEHRDAQQAGRDVFFSDYQIQVCRPERSYRFTQALGRVEATV